MTGKRKLPRDARHDRDDRDDRDRCVGITGRDYRVPPKPVPSGWMAGSSYELPQGDAAAHPDWAPHR